MRYGVSYYPEHKTGAELIHDLALIKESGINTVRMGEFAWSRMEPTEGCYDFTWLDPVIKELGVAGIRTILCTPTACPPPWMIRKHPDILYMDNRGVRRPVGGRRHYCYNHEIYRSYCAGIARELIARYGRNPDVAGFQIDNEPAQEGTGRCCCPVCQNKFRHWLKDKYRTIESFNQRSGSIFWSQEYDDFEEITIPVNTIEPGARNQIDAYYENPTIRLEFERFCSESQIEFQDIQSRILKAGTEYPVTTNGTGLATNSINNYHSTKELDCYAFDYYPDLRDAAVDSFPYAFARGIKADTPFWILEFMSGGGHRLSGSGRLQPNPGALKQAAVHAFAHGAGMLLHFQFRTFPFGAEQLNYSIVDMDGIPRRRYYEMKETASLLKQLEPLESAGFPQKAAILFDYDVHWSLRIKPVNDPQFHYISFAGDLYKDLAEVGINADVLAYDSDFTDYPLVVLPAAFILDHGMQDRLRAYVRQGGTLIATFLTGVKNRDNVGYTDPLPAGLTDLFGITVEEVEPVFDKNHTAFQFGSLSLRDNLWSELLSGAAESEAGYTEDYKDGAMVLSRNSYGKGMAYYVGTDLGREGWQALFHTTGREKNLCQDFVALFEGIELIMRTLGQQTIYFIFNYTDHDTQVKINRDGQDYLTKGIVKGQIDIERCGFRILVTHKCI